MCVCDIKETRARKKGTLPHGGWSLASARRGRKCLGVRHPLPMGSLPWKNPPGGPRCSITRNVAAIYSQTRRPSLDREECLLIKNPEDVGGFVPGFINSRQKITKLCGVTNYPTSSVEKACGGVCGRVPLGYSGELWSINAAHGTVKRC